MAQPFRYKIQTDECFRPNFSRNALSRERFPSARHSSLCEAPAMNGPIDAEADAQAGEFVRLLIEIQPLLRSFIGHLVPMADARDDLLQEVSMVIWQKKSSFTMSGGTDAGKDFRNWAYTIARFVVMGHQKQAKRQNQLIFGEDLINTLASEFEESDPRIAERMPALRRCLQKVPSDERRLLLERYSRHGAVENQAREEGRSSAALRGMLFRLRIALRRCVEQELQHQPEA
jgi:RNA polymerase sigma-70 factor, ECF subfamily